MAKKEIDGVEINGKSIIIALNIIKQVCEDNIGNMGHYNWKILEYEKFRALG